MAGAAEGAGVPGVSFHVPNKYRLRSFPPHPELTSDDSFGNNGCFVVPRNPKRPLALNIIASDGEGWEHVSVSTVTRCPTWEEMCLVKSLFWDDDDVVIQFHPRKQEYVNNHRYCLHMWRPVDATIPTPPSILVGI